MINIYLFRKLSNLTKNNYLTFPEFALAMYLTNLKIKGQDLPSKLPDNIRNEVMGVIEQIKVIEQEYQKRQHNQSAINPSHTQMISHQQYTGVPMGHNIGQYSSSNQSGIQGGPMMRCDSFTQHIMPKYYNWNSRRCKNSKKYNIKKYLGRFTHLTGAQIYLRNL